VVMDIIRLQGRPEVVEAAITSAALRDGKKVKISIPQDPGQAGKSQSNYLIRRLAGYSVTATPDTGDKVTRAEPVAAQVNVGHVFMQRAEWNNSFVHELRNFPLGTYDDQVDALSRAFNVLNERRAPMKISDDLLMKSAMPSPTGGRRFGR